MSEAGLEPLLGHDLVPPAGGAEGKLTVSLWLAERPAEPAKGRGKARTLALEGTR
jgi:hypothetical protein